MKDFMKILECINAFITPVGFIISVIAYIKINGVNRSLQLQKEKILFDKNYKQLGREIDNVISIIKTDGVNNNISAVTGLCDKIIRYMGSNNKKELKELKSHAKRVSDLCQKNDNDTTTIEQELICIKNIIISVGEKNGIG